MARIERFEDIQSWQKARELAKAVYTGMFAKDFGLKDQIRRAVVSIMLNIAEGFARKTNREFTQSLVIAHGPAAEVQAALYVALDQNYIDDTTFRDLYGISEETSKMLLGFINYLKQAK